MATTADDRFNISPERRLKLARHLYSKTSGKGWVPPDPDHPLIVDLVRAGFVRRTDGRCGFELMRDAAVSWTEAGRAACDPA